MNLFNMKKDQENNTREYKVDAKGRRLGPLASEVATLLMGKNLTNFSKHTVADVTVTIQNAAKMDIPKKKRQGNIYQSYSGYPSGRREETLGHLAGRLGYQEVLKRTIKGMLPKNKLQSRLLKNLIITE